jgi:hypothetical protein
LKPPYLDRKPEKREAHFCRIVRLAGWAIRLAKKQESLTEHRPQKGRASKMYSNYGTGFEFGKGQIGIRG